MAARRLLIIMLVLLGVSTLAAALVGNRPINEEGTGSTVTGETTETTPTDTVPVGKSLGIKIKVDGDGKLKVVPIRVGDQLALSVSSRRTDLVEIPALGLLEPVAPGAPAAFNLLANEVASYGVHLVEGDRVVARIEVTARPKKPARKQAKAGKQESG